MARRGNGEGGIRQKKNGFWGARITLDGKAHSFSAPTRAAAAKKLVAFQHDRDIGKPPSVDSGEKVERYLREWLEVKRGTLRSPRTWDRYEEYVRLHLVPTLGKVALAKLTPQQVQHLQAQKLASGLSSTTVHHIRAVLHTALRDALRLGLVPRNVSELVDAPRMHRQEMKVWTAGQTRTFLTAVSGDRLAALYTLAFRRACGKANCSACAGRMWTSRGPR